jgi:lipoprotein-releasing system permease protein
MSFTPAIARRYLWMTRKRRHTVFLSIISILGLAIGVGALLISIALLTGLQGQIKRRLIAASPQLLIEPAGRNTIDDSAAVIAAVHAAGIRDAQPLVGGICWGANEGERRGRPVRIRSYDAQHEPAGERGSRAATLADGEAAILLTRGLAAGLGLDTGDTITIVSPRTRLTPFGPVPIWRKFRIARLFVPGNVGDDRTADAMLQFDDASALFGTAGKPTSIETAGSAELAEPAQAALQAKFPALQVKTWKEINRPLFLALRLEKIVMFATISLIIFVAALNLISSLSMLIMEKRPQVGILRTLGATERNILSIFLQVGLLIGLTGTILGNIFGLGLSWAANRFHLVPLPNDVYFMSYLPFSIDVSDVLGVNAVAILLSIAATWYPARTASRLDPIVAIRQE